MRWCTLKHKVTRSAIAITAVRSWQTHTKSRKHPNETGNPFTPSPCPLPSGGDLRNHLLILLPAAPPVRVQVCPSRLPSKLTCHVAEAVQIQKSLKMCFIPKAEQSWDGKLFGPENEGWRVTDSVKKYGRLKNELRAVMILYLDCGDGYRTLHMIKLCKTINTQIRTYKTDEI